MKKANKKTIGLVADFTNCTSATDAYKVIAFAKFNNLKYWERVVIADNEVNKFFTEITAVIDNDLADYPKIERVNIEVCKKVGTKKPNVFKRFWNWITRKK